MDHDLVTVLLRDQLSKGELSLVADARSELVLEMRQAFQQTMRLELVSGVEQLTGRRVIAFMSANHVDPDLAIESFVLEPARDQNVNDSTSATILVAEPDGE